MFNRNVFCDSGIVQTTLCDICFDDKQWCQPSWTLMMLFVPRTIPRMWVVTHCISNVSDARVSLSLGTDISDIQCLVLLALESSILYAKLWTLGCGTIVHLLLAVRKIPFNRRCSLATVDLELNLQRIVAIRIRIAFSPTCVSHRTLRSHPWLYSDWLSCWIMIRHMLNLIIFNHFEHVPHSELQAGHQYRDKILCCITEHKYFWDTQLLKNQWLNSWRIC